MNKDVKELVKELEKKGWEYHGQNKHIKMKSPKGAVLIVPVSPSCHHALKNLKKVIQKIEVQETIMAEAS